MSIKDLLGVYALDASHSSIAFVVRYAMVTKVRGTFHGYEGHANINGANPSASSLSVVIEAASVNTNDATRDSHLQAPDFLDVAKYPKITFTAMGFEITDDETVNVTGDLTIRDATRSITIPFEFAGEATDPFGNARIGFEGRTSVSRKDFGLTWNAALETGGLLVSDKVDLEFEISAIKQA